MASIARGYPDPDGEIDHWVRRFLLPGRPTPTGKLLMTLTYAIKEGFTYTRRSEHGTQDPVATVRMGRGSCRDFALLMMEAVRSLGLAARFVSGYLYVPSAIRRRGRGTCRRRLDPRLVPGLSAGRRLGRVRSHQRHHRQPRSHPRRGRARSEPGHPALRHLCGKPGRRAGDESAGACDARGGRGGLDGDVPLNAISSSHAFGVLPSPLWGGVGGGGSSKDTMTCPQRAIASLSGAQSSSRNVASPSSEQRKSQRG